MQTYDPRYLGGIARFNRGEYFECHEVWEELWRETQGPARLFYKGLIQIAVTLHHARTGNARGACRLFQRSCRSLEAYRPNYLGVNVEQLLVEVECSVRETPPSVLENTGVAPRIELSPR
jgi:predicted metal-dependent hydrolase